MPSIAELKSITEQEAVDHLRAWIASRPPEPEAEFPVGSPVTVYVDREPCVGVVTNIEDGSPSVVYLSSEGTIVGPTFGYELAPLQGVK